MSELRPIPNNGDYEDMHHALGRPTSAKSECYRNHYYIEANSPAAKRFEALGWWDFIRTINGDRDAIYSVNGAGKEALEAWLKLQKAA